MGINVIQDFFFNNLKNEKANELYFRVFNGVLKQNELQFVLLEGGTLSTNTYFNSLPLKFILENTFITHIGVHVKIKGNVLFRVILLKENSERIILEKFINGFCDEIFWLNTISDKEKYDLAYVQFKALDKSIIENIEWVTDDPKNRTIKLAICCTTYNRPDDVKRLFNRLSEDSYLSEKCKLYIVNNGNAIDLKDTSFCRVIQNKNTGGTGGFMRGLLEARRTHEFSHVMFIDDDAFCEPLSIKKAINILEYASDDNSSVAGGMLYLDYPWIQYEAGAKLKPFNIESNNPNLDLREEYSLITNARTVDCAYGPWWFFIFPIKDDLKMSFPFFVRGDDVTFSLRNNFRPFILNGICSWQESFDAKISPIVEYFAFRSFVMISLLYLEVEPSNFALFKNIFSHIMREAGGYRYQIANALCIALEDILAGSKFWEDHLEMGEHIKEISRKVGTMNMYMTPTAPIVDDEPLVGKGKKIIAAITLFGNLLPPFLCRRGKMVFGLGTRPFVAFAHKCIYQYSPENHAVYVFKRHPLCFFKIMVKSFYLTTKLIFKRTRLKSQYVKALSKFESLKFWEENLK